jgi:hypothetical protein
MSTAAQREAFEVVLKLQEANGGMAKYGDVSTVVDKYRSLG